MQYSHVNRNEIRSSASPPPPPLSQLTKLLYHLKREYCFLNEKEKKIKKICLNVHYMREEKKNNNTFSYFSLHPTLLFCWALKHHHIQTSNWIKALFIRDFNCRRKNPCNQTGNSTLQREFVQETSGSSISFVLDMRESAMYRTSDDQRTERRLHQTCQRPYKRLWQHYPIILISMANTLAILRINTINSANNNKQNDSLAHYIESMLCYYVLLLYFFSSIVQTHT